VPTVAGLLGRSVARAAHLDDPPDLVCAGRTDAGVHATGQVVHLDLPASFDGDLARAVNRQTAPSVVVRRAEPAPEGFDARRSATSRRYRYLVWSAPVAEPLLAGLVWHVPHPLDVRSMAAASDPLLGEHDFRAFCRRPPGRAAEEPIVRRVTGAGWREVTVGWLACDGAPSGAATAGGRAPGAGEGWAPALLRFDIAANAFCHQMVRSVVAALVEAGRGRASAATVMALLASGSRQGAAKPAPPHGLCLVGVGYGGVRPAPAGGGLPPPEAAR
jgi:tRNA pseudouridine38-40 synthase